MMVLWMRLRQQQFLLTRPSRDVTNLLDLFLCFVGISTHTALAGRDTPSHASSQSPENFYSHVPRGT